MSKLNDMQQRQTQLAEMVEALLNEASTQGATSAEANVSSSSGLSAQVRKGELETIEHNRDRGLAITVYLGQRKGSASTSDFNLSAISETVSAACNIARYSEEDECAGLADAALMAHDIPDLDLYHPWDISVEQAVELGRNCEAAALALDKRITNSEGASFNTHNGLHVYGNSHGFIGGYPSSRHSLSCSVISQDGESMQRDYWYTTDRVAQSLESAETVGTKAGKRALARLGARKISTCQTPVIFQAEIAVSLLRSLVGALSGSALYRKASFLLDQLGNKIFPDFVHIYEDPLIPRGMASAAFDGDGVATRRKDLVQDGLLQSYILSSYSARKLGMQTTGNAGGVHNLFIKGGAHDLAGLMQEMGQGLLVTELIGHGVNLITGDYSRGAAGFWVKNGEIEYPVEEITIAGNLQQIFQMLMAVGRDEERRGGIHTGSWLIESMTVAGA